MISDSDEDWIGPWVRDARVRAGWTQEMLAFEVGVSKANVSAWERSKHQPSVNQFLAIWRLTGLTPRVRGLPLEWPFRNLAVTQFDSLTPKQLEAVEFGVLGVLATVRHLSRG